MTVPGTATPSPPNEAVADLILLVVPRTTRRIRRQMRQHGTAGLTVAQLRALLYVRRQPGSGPSAIADHLGMSLPATSALVQRLVVAGFLNRMDDPVERRRVKLQLTATGADHLAQTQAAVRAWLAQELAGFSDDDQKLLARALGILDRIGCVSEQPRGRSG